MSLKKIYLILFAALFAFSMIGCSDSDKKSAPPAATQQQKDITEDVMDAVFEAFDSNASGMKKEAEKGTSNFTWEADDGSWTAAGTFTWDDTNTYPVHFQVTFTWYEYTYEDVTLVSGTASLVADFTSDTSFTMVYTGDFDILYDETPYDFSWNLNLTYNYPNWSISGTASLNGTSYSISDSGVDTEEKYLMQREE